MNAKPTSPLRRSGNGPAAARSAVDPAPMMAGMDALVKQQLESMNECCCALLEGSQGMRRMQLDAAHEALQRHQACTHKLHSSATVSDALKVTQDALSADVDAASRYWNDLCRICNATMNRMVVTQVGRGVFSETQSNGNGEGKSPASPLAMMGAALTQPFGAGNPWMDGLVQNASPQP